MEFAFGELRRVSLGGLNNRRFAKRKRKTSHYVPYARKNKTDIQKDVRLFLVGAKGLEPLTSCV